MENSVETPNLHEDVEGLPINDEACPAVSEACMEDLIALLINVRIRILEMVEDSDPFYCSESTLAKYKEVAGKVKEAQVALQDACPF